MDGEILPLCSKFCAFLDGVIECIFWKVLKFVSFWSDFCQITGPGSQIQWVWFKFCSFWELEKVEFHGCHGFLSEFSAWNHKLK